MPDGRWHADQFLAGNGDWVVGIGTLLYKFNQIRLAIDPLGVRDDVVEIGTGLATTGQFLVANPGDAPAVLFDTRTMHDNPARWWGGLAPDIALTAVAGAGFATRALSGVRTGARVAEELTDAVGGARPPVPRPLVNRLGRDYPDVVDPRTGGPIVRPADGLARVPVTQRVTWGAQERGAFIRDWYDRGFETPPGGWAKYDLHHINPREFGGANAFDNLVPVLRTVHQQEFTAWWRDY